MPGAKLREQRASRHQSQQVPVAAHGIRDGPLDDAALVFSLRRDVELVDPVLDSVGEPAFLGSPVEILRKEVHVQLGGVSSKP